MEYGGSKEIPTEELGFIDPERDEVIEKDNGNAGDTGMIPQHQK